MTMKPGHQKAPRPALNHQATSRLPLEHLRQGERPLQAKACQRQHRKAAGLCGRDDDQTGHGVAGRYIGRCAKAAHHGKCHGLVGRLGTFCGALGQHLSQEAAQFQANVLPVFGGHAAHDVQNIGFDHIVGSHFTSSFKRSAMVLASRFQVWVSSASKLSPASFKR
jgi:hypothetical protein